MKISTVQIDIAEFAVEVMSRNDEELLIWVRSLAVCLAKKDGTNDYGSKLLTKVLEFQTSKSKKARKSAEARWSKKNECERMQSNANACERMQSNANACERMQSNANANQSMRNDAIKNRIEYNRIEQNEDKKEISPKGDTKKEKLSKPDDVSEGTWTDFLAHRKLKKAIVTDGVVDRYREEAQKAGMSLENALKESITRGWVGFKASWMEKEKKLPAGLLSCDFGEPKTKEHWLN